MTNLKRVELRHRVCFAILLVGVCQEKHVFLHTLYGGVALDRSIVFQLRIENKPRYRRYVVETKELQKDDDSPYRGKSAIVGLMRRCTLI